MKPKGWEFPVRKGKAKQLMNSSSLRQLIQLKQRLDAMKPLYAQYDELLQKVLNSGKLQDKPKMISLDGEKWIVEIVDEFALKNTAWKSVAHRRFNIAVSRARR